MNIYHTHRTFFQRLLPIFLLMAIGLTGCGRANQVEAEATWPIPALPETAAGHQFNSYLAAFNSGEQEQLAAFVAAHFTPVGPGDSDLNQRTRSQVQFYKSSHGLNLYQVTDSQETAVTVIAQLRLTQEWRRMTMFVDEAPPHLINGIMIEPIDAPALPASAAQGAEPLAQQIDDYIQGLVAADRFSGVVLVAKDGETLFEQAYGLANQETQIPNQIDTRFSFASVGKMFTAVAVAQLVEKGKLAYTDPISRYLPQYPAAVARQVTIEQLLTHRSGIPDFFADWARFQEVKASTNPQRDYLPLFMNEPLDFTPGERFAYSNSNYLLLGAIIEQVSGLTYETYLQTHIFAPADMTATSLAAAGIAERLLAQPYTELDADLQLVDGPRQLATTFQGAVGSAAGGGYTTVGDLLRFDQALRAHQLLSADATAALLTARVDYERPGYRYAYGFIVREQGGEHFVGHSGGSHGVDAQFEMDRSHGYTVILLANYEQVAEPILLHIQQLLHAVH